MNFRGRQALVLGLGASGRAAALKLLSLGCGVTVNDSGDDERLRGEAARLESRGIPCLLGSHPREALEGRDLLVVSPGVPASNPLIGEARARGVPIFSEIELAWRFTRVPVIAVTGTNGKTTTVSMIEAVLRRGGLKVKVAGNIGHPMVLAADEVTDEDYLLVEVSSFQLAFTDEFAPRVAVILNIADDHFDWHEGPGDYARAKAMIWRRQGPDDHLVLNLDDERCVRAGEGAPSRHVYFSRSPDPLAAVYAVEGRVVSRLALRPEAGLEPVEVMAAGELPLAGAHNLENAMAAAAVGLVLGVPAPAAGEALRGFEGLPHRLQFVAEVEGVSYYDDSKATNPDAAVRAIRSFASPLVPILGGRNKGLDLAGLAAAVGEEAAAGRIRGAVLLGEAAGELREALLARAANICLREAADMASALQAARELAGPGDAVVLAPACASFDQYADYAERGDHFQSLVRSLEGEDGDAGAG